MGKIEFESIGRAKLGNTQILEKRVEHWKREAYRAYDTVDRLAAIMFGIGCVCGVLVSTLL